MTTITDADIPAGHCRCPKCDGSKIITLTDQEKAYSWNKGKTTRMCDNCGWQYQNCTSRGYVRPNKEGQPCLHSYTRTTVGRCLTEYTCKHCNEKYRIDSGD